MNTISTPYLIVGSGRAAMHLKHYFGLKGIPFINWNRKQHQLPELKKAFAGVSVALLLLKDSAIEEFRNEHLKEFKGAVVHFSGSLAVDGIESFHPLMTFGPSLYDLDFYEKIHFAVSSKEKFHKLFPQLKNPVFELKADNKAFYHALCVMSGNFPQILWRDCLQAFHALGVPNEAVFLYLHKNLENFEANPGQSLTGPLARGDVGTIKKNINALPEGLRSLYQAFVRFYLPDTKI